MTYPITDTPSLEPATVVPESEDLFLPYLTNLYADIAETVNSKDNIYFDFAITSTAQNIPNIPNFGAFLICVSGSLPDTNAAGTVLGYLPTLTASLCKSSQVAGGSIAVLGSQAGTGSWAAINLTITSTTTNFQIAHNNAGVSGNFNIKFIGTQM